MAFKSAFKTHPPEADRHLLNNHPPHHIIHLQNVHTTRQSLHRNRMLPAHRFERLLQHTLPHQVEDAQAVEAFFECIALHR